MLVTSTSDTRRLKVRATLLDIQLRAAHALRKMAVGVPLFALGGIVLVVVARRRRDIFRKQQPPGHCVECGYDLRASKHKCPECGTPIAPEPR